MLDIESKQQIDGVMLAPIFQEDGPRCEIEVFLEEILSATQSAFGDAEIVKAKEEFFWKTGKVFYDDPFYEKRMSYFIDHFLLERPISEIVYDANGSTPFDNWRASGEKNPILSDHQHSLFQVIKSQGNWMIVFDLINNEKIEIITRDKESFRAIQKKDLFQGFLYTSNAKNYLSKGIIFHPPKAVRHITKRLKKALNEEDFDQLKYLANLAKQNLRHLRHAHVDPKRIYCESDT